MKKYAIIAASFGTLYKESCENTIGSIEKALSKAFPEVPVYRAFTSRMIVDMVRKKGSFEIDLLNEAIVKLKNEGYDHIFVQPTHIMNGPDYEGVKNEALAFDGVSVGLPLLNDEADCADLALVLKDELDSYDDGRAAIVLAGHGADEPYNDIYTQLEDKIPSESYFVGVLHGEPSVRTVLEKVRNGNFSRVCLASLMISHGGHARKNVMGDRDDSWKSLFESAGFEVICHEKGIGEYEGVADMISKHARTAFAI